MEFDAFGFYDFFFLFNSLRETFERVSNTSNCVSMFCPDISYFVFFIFTDEAIRQRSVRIRIEELFFSHGSSKFFNFFFVQSVYKVVRVLGFCENNLSEKCLRITRNEYI